MFMAGAWWVAEEGCKVAVASASRLLRSRDDARLSRVAVGPLVAVAIPTARGLRPEVGIP